MKQIKLLVIAMTMTMAPAVMAQSSTQNVLQLEKDIEMHEKNIKDKETAIKNLEERIDSLKSIIKDMESQKKTLEKELKNEVKIRKDKFTDRLEDRRNTFSGYKPEEVYKLDNARIIVQGNYVALIIAEDAGAMETLIRDAVTNG